MSHPPPRIDPLQPKDARYADLLQALDGMLCGCLLYTSDAADLNWAGFYRFVEGELIVGPFQGLPACVRIALGKGVCGTAALRRQTVVVEDVHTFDGHIACDAASRSEIVVPLIKDGRLLGVMDLDSPRVGRFDATDAAGLEAFAARLLVGCDL